MSRLNLSRLRTAASVGGSPSSIAARAAAAARGAVDAAKATRAQQSGSDSDAGAPGTAAAGAQEATKPLTEWPAISFEDRMSTAQFNVHERAHITVDGDSCRGCTTKQCVVACPANLFVPLTDGGILFNYEQCFECGTCYLVCNTEGAITWTYPEGGHGVIFKRT